MNGIITFIVSFTIFQLVFLALRQRLKIKELELEKERIERSRDRWEEYYKGYIKRLENRIDDLMKNRTIGNPKISSDTISAVRHAMKHAHPDNGGSTEDFMRFKKCYEELTGR